MSHPEVSTYLDSPEKRALDIAVASSAGMLALAAGSVAEAIVIAKNHWVAPVFSQPRIAKKGQPISVFKFRTWDYDGEKLKGVDRTRALGLDESPQFINVLLGQMSVVGYRPITSRDLNHACQRLRAHYSESSPYHPNNWLYLREQAKPGITGPSQTMALRSDAGSLSHLVDVVAAESDYILNANLSIDLSYLLKTPSAVIGGHNPTVAKSYLSHEQY